MLPTLFACSSAPEMPDPKTVEAVRIGVGVVAENVRYAASALEAARAAGDGICQEFSQLCPEIAEADSAAAKAVDAARISLAALEKGDVLLEDAISAAQLALSAVIAYTELVAEMHSTTALVGDTSCTDRIDTYATDRSNLRGRSCGDDLFRPPQAGPGV